jgi:hypothetical protein
VAIMLRVIFGHERNKTTGGYRKLQDGEVHYLYRF